MPLPVPSTVACDLRALRKRRPGHTSGADVKSNWEGNVCKWDRHSPDHSLQGGPGTVNGDILHIDPRSNQGLRAAGQAVCPHFVACGVQTYRVVLGHQTRTLDCKERRVPWVETLPEVIVHVVLTRVRTLLD